MMRWEYMTTTLKAEAQNEEAFLVQLKDWKDGIPKYTPEAMIPRLNAYGHDGWELISLQPILLGTKGDVLVEDAGSGSRTWTNVYMCVFKRALE
jgi:hypothetical protein